MNDNEYDEETGLPKDKSYLECGLPQWLEESIEIISSEQAWYLREKYLRLKRYDDDIF